MTPLTFDEPARDEPARGAILEDGITRKVKSMVYIMLRLGDTLGASSAPDRAVPMARR